MPRRSELSITMSAREVVAAGSAFLPRGEELHDAGVALDWISDLRPTSEPVALRVEARGGAEGERELVQGDWLCDSDGSAPSRVPWFIWKGPPQFGPQRWHWIDAWERKMNGAFCVGRAARIDCFKDARSLALAAADCALLVKEHLPAVAELGDITGALEAWRSGGRFVMPHDALVRCNRAMPAYDEAQADPGSRRRRAACSSLFFAIASAGDLAASSDVDRFASNLVLAVEGAADASGDGLGWVVRRRVPLISVLRALVSGSGEGG